LDSLLSYQETRMATIDSCAANGMFPASLRIIQHG